MESTERVIRINKVLRELNISLDSAVQYFNDNGIIIDSNPNYKLSDKEHKMLQNHFIVNNVGIIRINKVLRELNISLERAVDYLKDKGINIESNPNIKISNEVYNILCDQFAGDKGNNYASREVGEEKRKEKEALRFEREKEIENNQKKDKKHHQLVSNIVDNTNAKFYLLDSNSDNKNKSSKPFNEGFWQVINSNNEYLAITKKISIGDILISKSIFTNNDEAYLIVKEIGIVIESLNRRNKFDVAWIIKNQNVDIKISEISNYKSVILEPSKSILKKIFAQIESKDIKILDDALSGLQSELQLNQLKPNITTIPGLLCDSETGEDHLDIKKDVEAFARVIAAKSFVPPLAIALLGKWGSGKSFFMHKLKVDIQKLSKDNPEKAFCQGIAHVHFNAWSYMDANLWASMVTRIFEGLEDYIKSSGASDKKKKEIEEHLFQKLTISKDELKELNGQKEKVDEDIKELGAKREQIQEGLNDKIASIRKSTLINILKKVNEDFKVKEKIEKTLKVNPTFTESADKFEKIIPKEYWDNPEEFLKQLKNGYTFVKAFFLRGKILINILWAFFFIAIVILVPIAAYLLNLQLSWQDFTLTKMQWIFISFNGAILTRGIDTFLKLKKQIAPFWKIKEDYETQKKNALFTFEQEQKAIILEIEKSKDEIIQLNNQITINEKLKTDLEFKLKSALSTEALYNFIEKRANSDDYKKHLGIISLIRKDLEILSGLLTGHKTELVSNIESIQFKEMFHDKKPLERIILYIDDLDRCPEERVVEVLEAVNLLMAFPLFVVVVGVDPRWVKTALINKYNSLFTNDIENEDQVSPSNYLEKIFQVPFNLKDANDVSIKNMIKTLVQTKPNVIKSTTTEKSLFEQVVSKTNDDRSQIDFSQDQIKDEIDEVINNNLIEESLFNIETIQALDITERECELLEDMSEIIGNNPRAVKRFVNIYKIVKTHEDFNYDDETYDNELLVIIFLLAIQMGKFKLFSTDIESYITKSVPNVTPTFEYFESRRNGEMEKEIFVKRNKLHSIILIKHQDITNIDIKLFKKHINFIKRFTFKNI